MADQDEFRYFIGNLSWSTSERGLNQAFEKFGHLVDAKVRIALERRIFLKNAETVVQRQVIWSGS
ncbi:hypothetical protein ACS0TY_029522 [Phlomoides rotata]